MFALERANARSGQALETCQKVMVGFSKRFHSNVTMDGKEHCGIEFQSLIAMFSDVSDLWTTNLSDA